MKNFSFKLSKPNRKQLITMVCSLFSVLLIGVLVYYGYTVSYNKNAKITSIMVVNQTESSATVVWQTDRKVKGSLEVEGYRYYDSRDIEEIALGEYKVNRLQKRYTHYVTIPKLEAEKEYSFMVKHDFVEIDTEVESFKTAKVAEDIKDPEPVYGYVFDGEGLEITDALVLMYVEIEGDLSQPIGMHVSDNGSFTIDVGMIRSGDLNEQLSLPEQYWEVVYVWSEYGELMRRVDSRYDQPIGGIGTEGDRLQYGDTSGSLDEQSNNFSFEVSASKDSPACAAGDATNQIYGECCGNGKAREVRRCVDSGSGAYYYKFSDCEHEASHCGGGGLDSKCNNNGNRDCEGYSTGNCEGGVDCGNSVCGSCASQSGGGVSDHCKNGVKDSGIEEGVDCGGACPACAGSSSAAQKSDACPPGGCVAPETIPDKSGQPQEKITSANLGEGEFVGAKDYCISNNLYTCSSAMNCILKKRCSTSGCKKNEGLISDSCVDNAKAPRSDSGNSKNPNYNKSDFTYDKTCRSYTRVDGSCCDMHVVVDGKKRDVTQVPGAPGSHSRVCSLDLSVPTGTNLDDLKPSGCNECTAGFSDVYGCYVEMCGTRLSHLNYPNPEQCRANACNNTLSGNTGKSTAAHVDIERRGVGPNCSLTEFDFPIAPCEQMVDVGVDTSKTGGVWSGQIFFNSAYAEFQPVDSSVPNFEGRDPLYEQYVKEVNSQDIINLYPGVYEVGNPNLTTDIVYIKDKYDRVVYFDDRNGNGIKDEDEQYLNAMESRGIQLNLKQVAEVMDYNLALGWNFVAFPMHMEGENTSNILKASDLIEELRLQEVIATHVVTLRNGVFWVYTTRHMDNNENFVLGEDFNILPGEGYIVYSLDEGKVSLAGKKVDGSLDILLNSGWNLVGIYHSDVEYFMSNDVISMFSEQNSSIDTVTQFTSGRYQSYIVKEGSVFGFNFEVYPDKAYWIYMGEGENVRVMTRKR